MSKNLYDATLLQLRGRALEAYAALEMLFDNPSAVPDHTQWVKEIVTHACLLAENENTIMTLQKYFGPRFAPKGAPTPPQGRPAVPPPPETHPSVEPSPVSHDELMKRSTTYRKSMDTAKLKSLLSEKKKKEATNKTKAVTKKKEKQEKK